MSAQPQPKPLDVSRFYTHAEITDILRSYEERYPELASLSSIGQSYEGRDIWVLTITNQDTGGAESKPAMYIDGNIHAGEVTGSNVCLYTVDQLLTRYGNDAVITQLLDNATFYILPRVSPDGSDKYLTTPEMLRSSVRIWPYEDEDDGLVAKDIDGDGHILQMRVKDPNGEWKISEKDPRLMVRRAPDDVSGEFYRLYTEGEIRNPRPGPIKMARSPYGLDQNRNWPANWTPTQRGAGPYPLSEPETSALAAFVEAHPNICIVQNYHTTGGVILRAPCIRSDSQIPQRDLAVYKAMGEIGTELTGYPCSPVYDAFPTTDEQGRRSTAGGFIEWTYEHKGILSFSTELWDIKSRAGIERKPNDPMRGVAEETEADGLAILAWLDKERGGKGFVEWRGFEHPQLGQVEIGGWLVKEVRQNAPSELLLDECQRNAAFSFKQAAMLPRLKIGSVEVEQVAPDLHIVRVGLVNTGYLSTNVSDQALRSNAVKPITVTIEGADVLLGQPKTEVGQIPGRASLAGAGRFAGRVENERMLEYLVRGNGVITVTAHSERAGTDRRSVELDA
ncbi:MAG TPA: M14 family metallopeptidase [Thermomicrobiaceae bacterium]|nr:M14 family metallopeptidase [Thermomicrobiaceae bacterium]